MSGSVVWGAGLARTEVKTAIDIVKKRSFIFDCVFWEKIWDLY